MADWLVSLAGWLADLYLLAGALLLITFAAMLLVRQPARRTTLARAALAGLFALAILSALPHWPRVRVPHPTFKSPAPPAIADAELPDIEGASHSDEELAADFARSTREVATAGATPVQRTPAAASPASNFEPAKIGALLFLSGAAGCALWLAIGAALTVRLRKTARRAPDPIQDELARLLGQRRASTSVLLSDRVNQALAVGVVRPRIILPDRFLGQETCEALNAALAHETSHVRNGDLRMLFFLRLLLPIMFAHPLYWWLRWRVRIDQELLADAAAVDSSDVADYADILLDWFRTSDANRSRLLTASLGLWESPHSLKRRIAVLLNDRFRVESRSPLLWRLACWPLLLAAALLISPATLQSTSSALAEDQPDTPPVLAPSAEIPSADPLLPEEKLLASAGGENSDDEKDGEKADDESTQEDDSPAKAPPKNSKYQSAEEAFRAGAIHYNARNFAASRKPFEAALALAPNDEYRMKVYEALRPSYRVLNKVDKMFEACDFIIRHADFEPKRSLTRRDLLSFAYQRGKLDQLIKRYEVDLKKDGKDRTALYVLSEAYDRYKRDPARAAQLTRQLLALDEGDSVDVPTSAKLAMQYVRQKKYRQGAELYEKIAPLDEQLAAWHFKEAAKAWLALKENDKALAAAEKSAAASPENRSRQLTHYWQRALGEVFLATGQPRRAIGHLEKAIENTDIDGYLNDCRKLLVQAQAQAEQAN